MDPEMIKVNFVCPLCQALASPQPVLAEDGFIYHYKCISIQHKDDDAYRISPMTGARMGSSLVSSQSIKSTIEKLLSDQCNCTGENDEQSEKVAEIMMQAKLGDAQCMATLGRWHLFGEQQGVEIHIKCGFDLVKSAHEKNNIEASAYYGHCLVRGLGVTKNKSEGFELLVDAACEGKGEGKDFAAYTLGYCYKKGYFGFKQDEKKATKWLNKVVNKPDDKLIWDPYEFNDDVKANELISESAQPDEGVVKDSTGVSKLPLFDDAHSSATITTASLTNDPSTQFIDISEKLNFLSLTRETTAKCEVCKQVFESKDLMSTTCRKCFDEDINSRGLSYFIGGLGES